MNGDRSTLEELKIRWKKRLEDAETRLTVARGEVRKFEQELRAKGLPSPDLHYAYQRALRTETLALERYARVMIVFNDLVLHGAIPEDQPGRE